MLLVVSSGTGLEQDEERGVNIQFFWQVFWIGVLVLAGMAVTGCGETQSPNSKEQAVQESDENADLPEFLYFKLGEGYYKIPTDKYNESLDLGASKFDKNPKQIKNRKRLVFSSCCSGLDKYYPIETTDTESHFIVSFSVGINAFRDTMATSKRQKYNYWDTSSPEHFSKFATYNDDFYLISNELRHDTKTHQYYQIILVSKQPLYFSQHIDVQCQYLVPKNRIPRESTFSFCSGGGLDSRVSQKQEITSPPKFDFYKSWISKKGVTHRELTTDLAIYLTQFEVIVESMYLGKVMPDDLKKQGYFNENGEQ